MQGESNATFLGDFNEDPKEDSLIALIRKAASLPDELMDTAKDFRIREIARGHIKKHDFAEIRYFQGTPDGIEDIENLPDEGELPDLDWAEQPTQYDP